MNQSSLKRAAQTGQHQPSFRVAVVSSSWHRNIVNKAVTSIEQEFSELPDCELAFFEVPGAFEIPLYARRLARSGQFDGVIACGLVVDGGIYRHEFVAAAVIDGLMKVQLECDVPVFSAVLTPHHFHEGSEHIEFFASHFIVKGREVAQACISTLRSLEALAATS